MSKPNWCPQRVWDEADQVSIRPDVSQIEMIARAILAAEQREREQCGEIAERFGGAMGEELAAAIRNRGTEND